MINQADYEMLAKTILKYVIKTNQAEDIFLYLEKNKHFALIEILEELIGKRDLNEVEA